MTDGDQPSDSAKKINRIIEKQIKEYKKSRRREEGGVCTNQYCENWKSDCDKHDC